MKTGAPLFQLKSYFVTKLEMEADPRVSPPDEYPLTPDRSQIRVLTSATETAPQEHRLHLEIKSDSQHEALPYSFQIIMVGFIEVNQEHPRSGSTKIIQNNAYSMLYSAARELLMTITARSPYPACMLPTVQFLGREPEPQQELELLADSEHLGEF